MSGKSASHSDVYTWTNFSQSLQVRIPFLTIHALQARLEKTGSDEGGPLQECGLLLGTTGENATEISRAQPLPSLDTAMVKQALAAARPKAVGFYRSTSPGSLETTQDDWLLAKTFFASPNSVILLIEAGGSGAGNAVFCVWERGRLQANAAVEQFPFDAYQLVVEESRRSPHPAGAPRPMEEGVPSEPRSTALNLSSRSLLWPVLLIALTVAGFFYFSRRPAAPAAAPALTPAQSLALAQPAVETAPAKSTLALNAERRGGDLMLSWNRGSPAILNAVTGILFIQAGTSTRDLVLTPDQLRSGSVLYTPTADQVEIRLEVVGSGQRVTNDSVIVLLPQKPQSQPVVMSQPAPASAPAPEISQPPGPAVPANQKAAPARTFSLPRTAGGARPPRIDEAPPSLPFGAGPAATAALPLGAPSVPPPPASAPPPSAAGTTAAAPQPPVPLRQVIPRFPPGLKNVVLQATTVEVTVSVSAEGKVIKAVPGPGKANVLLVQAAVQAARFWTFRPARVDNRAVPAEVVLKFNFTPDQ
ncbi:MAG TPA: hypothetical protein VJ732_16160 [Bryobacteraceae bacterium]|nr:hypothetical protein [Bryobacteraceae bacterium]